MSDKATKPKLAYGDYREKLTPDDVDGKTAILHVLKAERKNFAPEGRGEQWKVVLTFTEFPGDGTQEDPAKEYIVNSTSYKTLCQFLGDDEDRWNGKEVVMAPTTSTFDGKTFEKIHVAPPDGWKRAIEQSKKPVSSSGGRKTTTRR